MRRLVAKGLAVEGTTGHRGIVPWRAPDRASDLRGEARLFARGAIAEAVGRGPGPATHGRRRREHRVVVEWDPAANIRQAGHSRPPAPRDLMSTSAAATPVAATGALERHPRFEGVVLEYRIWLDGLAESERKLPGDRNWRSRCVVKACELLLLRVGRVTGSAVHEIIGFGSNTQVTAEVRAWQEKQATNRHSMLHLSDLFQSADVEAAMREAIITMATATQTEARRIAREELEAERAVMRNQLEEMARARELAESLAAASRQGAVQAEGQRDAARADATQAREAAAVIQSQLVESQAAKALAREDATKSRDALHAAIERLEAARGTYTKEIDRLQSEQRRNLMEIENARSETRAVREELARKAEEAQVLAATLHRDQDELRHAAVARAEVETELRVTRANLTALQEKVDSLQRQVGDAAARADLMARSHQVQRAAFAKASNAAEVAEGIEAELQLEGDAPVVVWLSVDGRAITPRFESVAALEAWCEEYLDRLLALDPGAEKLFWE